MESSRPGDLRREDSSSCAESDVLASASSSGSFQFSVSGDSRSSSASSSNFSEVSAAGGSSGDISADVVMDAVMPRLMATAILGGDSAPEESGRERLKCMGRHDRISWGSVSVIGRRKEMEDSVTIMPRFMSIACRDVGGCIAPGSVSSGQILPLHFFSVYDGHGGSQVAKFCSERMHEIIAEEWDKAATDGHEWRKKWEAVFCSAFKRADEEVLREANANDMVGSTAVVSVLSQCQIIVSNCGDSRAVLCRRTGTIPLTVDQKPDREDELKRIEQAGGKVINWNGARVLGVLAMSRSIGDHYMRPYVIPVPEVTFMTRTDEDECLILASDGLWDVMSNDEVGNLARRLLKRQQRNMADDGILPAKFAADNLQSFALAKNSSDNISIIVVDLKARRRRQPRQSA